MSGSDGDDHIAFLVPLLDVAVSLGSLFQRIASVDDRFDLPGLDQRLDRQEVLKTSWRKGADDSLAAHYGRPEHLKELLHLEACEKQNAVRLERSLAACERRLAEDVEDQVVGLTILREVRLGVVNDVVGTQGSDEFRPRGA